MYYLAPLPQPRIRLQTLQTLHKCSFRQHPIPFFISLHLLCLRMERVQRQNESSEVFRTLLYIHAFTRRVPPPILRHALTTASLL
ncbi:hypothetical protein BDR04DRAFT_478582 [Suillus decipiens]|nr:hypothetical protein BDR04DRAFT_478582 [Suillus decipiens]